MNLDAIPHRRGREASGDASYPMRRRARSDQDRARSRAPWREVAPWGLKVKRSRQMARFRAKDKPQRHGRHDCGGGEGGGGAAARKAAATRLRRRGSAAGFGGGGAVAARGDGTAAAATRPRR